jgi:hypothetical protein
LLIGSFDCGQPHAAPRQLALVRGDAGDVASLASPFSGETLDVTTTSSSAFD